MSRQSWEQGGVPYIHTHSSYSLFRCLLLYSPLWCSARYYSHHHDQIRHVQIRHLQNQSHGQILPQDRIQGAPQPAFPYQNLAQSLFGRIPRIPHLHRLVQSQLCAPRPLYLLLGPADSPVLGNPHLLPGSHPYDHQGAQGVCSPDCLQGVPLGSQEVQAVVVQCQESGMGPDEQAEWGWPEKEI